MFLPIGDTPNPERFTPYVNWALIAANVVVFLLITLPLSAQPPDLTDPGTIDLLDRVRRALPPGVPPDAALAHVSAYDAFVLRWGYVPARPSLVTLLSSMFLHGGFAHLAGNMLFLWIFGDNVEHRLGRLTYALVYVLTGVLATLTFALFAHDSTTPLVGASGAISGVLGLYFICFPRNRVKVLIAFFPFYVDVVLIGARWVLGFYLLFDNLLPFLIQAKTSVAHGAHIGGFLAGGLWGFVSERWGSRLRASVPAGPRDEAIAQTMMISDRELTHLPIADIESHAGLLMSRGHLLAASSFLRRALITHRGGPSRDLARIYLLLGLVRLEQGQTTSAYQHLLTVLDLEPDPATARDAHQALEAIHVYQRRRS